MKILFHFIVSLILICFIISCNKINSKNKNILSEKFGTSIDYIDSLKYFNLIEGWIPPPQQYPLKIVTYINADCNQCLYDLLAWKEILKNHQNDKVSFLFYIKIFDLDALALHLNEIEFQYPVIIDYYGTFSKENSLIEEKMYQTFLVDGNNKIMLIGNPLLNDKIEELYFTTIRKTQLQ